MKALAPDLDFKLEAVLMLPEEAITTTAMSLASSWKYLQLLTDDDDIRDARISAYFFCATIHPNLEYLTNAD